MAPKTGQSGAGITPRRTFYGAVEGAPGSYLKENVYTFVFQKPNPPQIHQLILYYHSYEEYVDGFVREFASAKGCYNRFL